MSTFVKSFLCILPTISLSSTVTVHLQGQLGNQLFQVATAVALALENDCSVYFPDFEDFSSPQALANRYENNYNAIFYRLPQFVTCAKAMPSFQYIENGYDYHPIPYQPNMAITGFFESEKHFKKYRNLLLELFAPPEFIEKDLRRDFSSVIEHPKTVGIHVRTYFPDLKNSGYQIYQSFIAPDIAYYKKAIEMFDPDSLFIVCSDHISWCEQKFSQINRNFIFVKGQDYLHDFFLLSKCKNIILGSSTFSWWAAYLNQNENKKVVCRKPFLLSDHRDPKDIICEDWTIVHMPKLPPFPFFMHH
ncbi:MAG: alpha-1,2-fucosyltransferase [Chlamydiota bacterium]